MYSKLALVAIVASAVNALQVNTPPSLVECQPTQITFSDGTSPYFLSILPGGDSAAAAIEDLPNADSSPVTWIVNIAAGTNVTIRVTDGTGDRQYSSPLVIQSGSDSSCVGQSGGGGSSRPIASVTESGLGTLSAGEGPPTSSAVQPSNSATPSGAALPGAQVGGLVFTVLGLVAAAFGVAV